MKNTLKLLFLFCVCFGSMKAQTELYSNIIVNTVPANYTVTATNDTTFERELIIYLIDTVNFQSLDATLSIKSDTTWQTIQNRNLSIGDLQEISCNSILCFYRRQRNVWVLPLGNYSLFTRHRIELHFSSLMTGGSADVFSNEF